MKKRVIKKTRKVGKAWLYMIDKEDSLTKLLQEIDMKISDFFIKKEMEKQADVAR